MKGMQAGKTYVYILIRENWYESSEILSVHTSIEDARRAAESYVAKNTVFKHREKEDYWEDAGAASVTIEKHTVL